MSKVAEEKSSSLMKLVEAIAISPDDARIVVSKYQNQVMEKLSGASKPDIDNIVIDKIISRYCKLAAMSGGVTSLAGIVPGIGTAVAVTAGGLADVSASMKLQIDMTMCLAIAINDGLSNEDAKNMSYIIALTGSLEHLGATSATRIASKAGVKMVNKYLTGGTLEVIKALFKSIGITFTQKAAAKAIPFGIGVVIGSSLNYALTKFVGNQARDFFLLDLKEKSESKSSKITPEN